MKPASLIFFFFLFFLQRLKDFFGQNWHEKQESKSRFLEQKLVKQSFGPEECMHSMKDNFRYAFLKFRTGVSWAKVHSFRFIPESDNSDQKEDYIQVLCDCTQYDNTRHDFSRRESLHMLSVYHSGLSTSASIFLVVDCILPNKGGEMRQSVD